MERYVLPIRELPGKERRKNISNKYKNKIPIDILKYLCFNTFIVNYSTN